MSTDTTTALNQDHGPPPDATPKPPAKVPRILTVSRSIRLTPNMIRITFAGPALSGLPSGCEGCNCKIFLPQKGETPETFAIRLHDGPPPPKRTYTVRHLRTAADGSAQEMDIDFVVHGDDGPAASWALRAQPGSFLGFTGPSKPKIETFYADWYLVAADMAGLPVAAATLEALPREAKGIALFEVISEADRQEIDAPPGIEQHWLIHSDPHERSDAQETFIRSMAWPPGVVQTCIAGESGVIRSLRAYLHNERGLPRHDTYISGYWKIGMVEDEHQQARKRGEAG